MQNPAIADIIQSLRRIFKAIQESFQEISKKYGITGPQLWALKTVAAKGSLSPGELSKKMYLCLSTISGEPIRLNYK